jgi:hypothetical protein
MAELGSIRHHILSYSGPARKSKVSNNKIGAKETFASLLLLLHNLLIPGSWLPLSFDAIILSLVLDFWQPVSIYYIIFLAPGIYALHLGYYGMLGLSWTLGAISGYQGC